MPKTQNSPIFFFLNEINYYWGSSISKKKKTRKNVSYLGLYPLWVLWGDFNEINNVSYLEHWG